MSLASEISSHHTVWVARPDGRVLPIRYASADGHLYCFGDDGLATLPDGAHVRALLRRIASGPAVAEFGATLHAVDGTAIDREIVLQLLEHVPLGRTLDEVERSLERHQHRRVVELVP